MDSAQTQSLESTAEHGGGRERVLLFRLRRVPYALPLSAVFGLAECGDVRRVPGAPRNVLGMTEWRGDLLTVLDLPRLLRHSAVPGRACLIRLAAPLQQIAFYLPCVAKLAEVTVTEAPTGSGGGVGIPFTHEGRSGYIIDPIDMIRRLEIEIWDHA